MSATQYKASYKKLPAGKKRQILQEWNRLFGYFTITTFYRKLSGSTRVRPNEQEFFNNKLL